MEPKVKKIRIRSLPVKKWSSEDTKFLLKLLKQSGKNNIEKPTAQVYYSRLIESNRILDGYTWKSVRDKLKNLKIKYKAALDWRANAGLDEIDDATTIREKLLQICPDFDILHDIYSEKMTIYLSSIFEASDDFPINIKSEPPQEEESVEETSVTTAPEAKKELKTPQFRPPKRRSSSTSSMHLQAEVQQDRLQYYEKKLELERENEYRKLQIAERGQELEKMKIELERERNRVEDRELELKEREMEVKWTLEREKMTLEREKMTLEREKMTLEREKMKHELEMKLKLEKLKYSCNGINKF